MFSLKELVTDASQDQAAELHSSLCAMFHQVAERPLGGLNTITVCCTRASPWSKLVHLLTAGGGLGAREGLWNSFARSQAGSREMWCQAEGVHCDMLSGARPPTCPMQHAVVHQYCPKW